MRTIWVLFILFFSYSHSIYSQEKKFNSTQIIKQSDMKNKTPEEWKKILNDEEYRVLIEKGTEYPHTGKYNMHFENGVYNCNACKTPLFNSDQKFKSDCGWPSFDESIKNAVKYVDDYSLGRYRVEIICASCNGHLGHVFDDGPTETGKRYCVNSVSIDFNKKL
ncbi:MAG: peptide-methionine (R)-S-oxide reductase [Gammaproteobacteria bacterium]|nr:peptide-methionine (R)-S-oxide reductase [Gammaproteobacteria bacterium]